MTIHLAHEVLRLALRDPFRIARSDHGAGREVTTVIVEIRDDRFPGLDGVGEGYPDRYYGETPETMATVLPMLVDAVGEWAPEKAGLAAAGVAMDGVIHGHGAAKCALDIALHDLAGKVAGVPVHELLGLSANLPPTDFTIGIDTP
ncbi:MAG: dipeptide epimerase, partial [Candidatus Limnocylindrales bacterium]